MSAHLVGLSEAPTRYEILRGGIVQLVNSGDISLQPIAEEDGEEVMLLDDGPQEPPTIDTVLPPYGDLSHMAEPPGLAQTLLKLAKECEGLSGRKLANIPSDVICWRMPKDVCTMEEALEVMGLEIAGLQQRRSS